MATVNREELICDICGRSANGESPDNVACYSCGHDICSDCGVRIVRVGAAVFDMYCKKCGKKVELGHP